MSSKTKVSFTARDVAAANDVEESAGAKAETLVLDPKGLLGA